MLGNILWSDPPRVVHPTFRLTAEPVGICAVARGNTISFSVIQPIFLHKYRARLWVPRLFRNI